MAFKRGLRNLKPTGGRMAWAVGLLTGTIIVAMAIALFAELPADGGENEVQEFLGGGAGFTGLVLLIVGLLLGWPMVGSVLMVAWPRKRVEIHFWIAIVGLAAILLHGLGLQGLGDDRGWLSGWLAVVAITLLWVTGWKRRAFIEAWGTKPWRWVHWQLAVGALLLSLEHWLLIEASK